MAIQDLLPHTIQVQRRVLTADGMGGYDATFNISTAAENIRIWTTKENLIPLPSGQAVTSTRKMAAKSTADIKVKDKLVSGDDGYWVISKYPVYDKTSLHHYEFDLSLTPHGID